MKKHIWKIVVAGLLAVFALSFLYANQAAEKANQDIEMTDHVKGNSEAEVVLVEYADFQCPACRQFIPYIDSIMDDYGDQIRLEFKNFPLTQVHPNAKPAAIAAEAAAQQGEFFAMHDMLYENQSEWSGAASPEAYFKSYAAEIGLDMDKFSRHLDSSLLEDAVMEDFNEALSHNFNGTPSFLLNGESMEFSSFEEFRAQIEAAVGVENENENQDASTEAEAEGEATTTINMGTVKADPQAI